MRKRISNSATRIPTVLALALTVYSVSIYAADVTTDIRSMFANGAWNQALATLEKTPNVQTNPALRELLGMAYLYTASELDSMGNLEKARTLMKQIVDQGGKARFLVSLGRDKKKEINLVEATPGEIALSSSGLEFQAQKGINQPAQRWEKSNITECGLNSKYGKTSNSFHITLRDKSEVNFRPLHFSADETNLFCSLLGTPATPAKK